MVAHVALAEAEGAHGRQDRHVEILARDRELAVAGDLRVGVDEEAQAALPAAEAHGGPPVGGRERRRARLRGRVRGVHRRGAEEAVDLPAALLELDRHGLLPAASRHYLIEGRVGSGRARVVRDGASAVALARRTRIAYKRRVGDSNRWRLHVLDLASGRDVALAENRSTDDQPEWLGDDTIVYSATAVRELEEDLAAGRVAAVCDRLTERAARQIGSVGHRRTPTTCVRDLREFLYVTSAADGEVPLRRAPMPEVVATRIDRGGASAVATVTLGGDPFRLRLAREGGRWKLDDFFGAVAPPPRPLR